MANNNANSTTLKDIELMQHTAFKEMLPEMASGTYDIYVYDHPMIPKTAEHKRQIKLLQKHFGFSGEVAERIWVLIEDFGDEDDKSLIHYCRLFLKDLEWAKNFHAKFAKTKDPKAAQNYANQLQNRQKAKTKHVQKNAGWIRRIFTGKKVTKSPWDQKEHDYSALTMHDIYRSTENIYDDNELTFDQYKKLLYKYCETQIPKTLIEQISTEFNINNQVAELTLMDGIPFNDMTFAEIREEVIDRLWHACSHIIYTQFLKQSNGSYRKADKLHRKWSKEEYGFFK